MNIYKNKGMYIEELINNSSSYYDQNGKFYIEKRFLPIIPTSIKNNMIIGKLIRKSSVDYNCLFKGKYIDFEVKQTDNEFFDIKKVKKHQLLHLHKVIKYKGLAFLLVYFFNYDVCLLIDFNFIEECIKKNQTKIYYNDDKFKKYTIDIIFPGILDFESCFNKYI